MPMYEYKCLRCGKQFERLIWSSDKKAQQCECGGETKRILSVTSSHAKSGVGGCAPTGSNFT